MNGLRRAALALHALAPADQEWMLARLPAARAAELRPLLEELQDIGIPADPELIRSAIDARSASTAQASGRGGRTASASADQVHAILANEPDGLIAMVLSGGSWPWRDALLAKLGADRAHRIRELALTTSGSAAVRRAALEEFVNRVELCADDASESASPNRPWGLKQLQGRLAQRWSAWTR